MSKALYCKTERSVYWFKLDDHDALVAEVYKNLEGKDTCILLGKYRLSPDLAINKIFSMFNGLGVPVLEIIPKEIREVGVSEIPILGNTKFSKKEDRL
jgi:hypothetical protein